MLKSLEEPNNNTYFILISHQFSNLLPTIKSRCIKYVITKPSYDDFFQILQNNNNLIDIADNDFLYNITNGSSGLALEIYSKNIKNTYKNIIQILLNNDPLNSDVVNLANEVSSYSNEEFKNFLMLIKFIILSIIKINLGCNFKNFLFSDSFKYLIKIANLIPNSASLEILEFLNENEKNLFIYNLDKKIFCFNIFKSLSK